jgi:3'(2'), 5'-bisphosphate nucleotidase
MAGTDQELEEILRIARAASIVVREVYATAFSVELKGPNDPVTRADREANTLICSLLGEAFPGDAVIAEESVTPEAVRATASRERVFYVDPLDGTREFVDRNGEFAVMIGLAVRGRAHLGVVVLPVTGEALAGRTGLDSDRGEAFIEDESGSRRPLEVPPPGDLDPSAARLVVSRSHRPPLVEKLSIRLGLSQITPCGSVGVKVARVATGRADLYVHDGGGAKRWDTCGPEAILRAAGGRFTDLRGDPIVYAGDDLVVRGGLVASNGRFHDVTVEAARALLAGDSAKQSHL